MRSIFLLVFFAACDGSSPAPTFADTTTFAVGSISVALTVTSNGAAALFDAKVSNGTAPLHLGASDVLAASASDATERPLVEYAPGKFVLLLPTQASVVNLSFTRVGKVVSLTALLLPTPFTIAPAASNVRSKGIALAWEPGMMGELLTLDVRAPCVTGMKLVRTPDPIGSTFTLQAADFSTTTGTCILDVGVTRKGAPKTTLANLAPGSVAELVQSRNLEIVTQP